MSQAPTSDATPAPHAADRHDLIRVHGARVNNLRDVSIEIPKRRLTVFTGVASRQVCRRSLVVPFPGVGSWCAGHPVVVGSGTGLADGRRVGVQRRCGGVDRALVASRLGRSASAACPSPAAARGGNRSLVGSVEGANLDGRATGDRGLAPLLEGCL